MTAASLSVPSATIVSDFNMDSLEKLDSLWSCYVCFVNFTVGMFCFGIQNSYGIIHIAVIQQFEAKNVESGSLITPIFI